MDNQDEQQWNDEEVEIWEVRYYGAKYHAGDAFHQEWRVFVLTTGTDGMEEAMDAVRVLHDKEPSFMSVRKHWAIAKA